MNTGIVTSIAAQVNIQTGLKIIVIRIFNRKGEWQLEVVFSRGAKVTGPVTADEVSIIESDLTDRGWQVEPSLFCAGFNARPGECEELIPTSRGWAVPLSYCQGLVFASSAGLWPEDYGLDGPTL